MSCSDKADWPPLSLANSHYASSLSVCVCVSLSGVCQEDLYVIAASMSSRHAGLSQARCLVANRPQPFSTSFASVIGLRSASPVFGRILNGAWRPWRTREWCGVGKTEMTIERRMSLTDTQYRENIFPANTYFCRPLASPFTKGWLRHF